MDNHLIIIARAAAMPASCWGRYARLGVVRTVDGKEPSMLSARARTVDAVLETHERLHVGKASERSAFMRALADVQARYPSAAVGESVRRIAAR